MGMKTESEVKPNSHLWAFQNLIYSPIRPSSNKYSPSCSFTIMTRGKQTCRILKEIRRQIAEANNIEYVTSECRFKGECAGTCPLCEAEVRYLEQELHMRKVMGKAVVLAGLSVEMIGMAACSTPSQETTVENRPCTADTSVIADLSADRPVILEEIDSIEAKDSFPKASSASKNVKKRTQKNNPEYLDLDTANWMMGDIPSEKPAVYKDYYYDDESGLRVSLVLSEWATFPGERLLLTHLFKKIFRFHQIVSKV